MSTKNRRKWKWLIVIVALLALVGWFVYQMLFPKGPILDEVANPVRDRAIKDWATLESEVPKNDQRNLYFGDLHVHTAFSFDAYIGGILPKPDDAYRFAKGEPIKVFTDEVSIERPLDFAAVTDHSEYLGELYSIHTPGAPAHSALTPRYFRSIGMDTLKQREMFNRLTKRTAEDLESDEPPVRGHIDFFQGFETTKSAWDIQVKAVEDHYDPGTFTTLAAYEWTLGMAGAHAHRNVFFKDMMVPDYPISALEATDEEQLWTSMEKFRSEGATVMAVPHNSNLSEGEAFPISNPDGSAFSQNYLKRRQKNEPLVEIHQAKGNSEVHSGLWSNDEFAAFEEYNQGAMNPNNYVRHILKRGVAFKDTEGVNPFQYGFIGSTDTHDGTPGNTEEGDEFRGNHAFVDYTANLRRTRNWVLDETVATRDVINPGGLMGVWAKANTRTEIYEAMERKETYATSGGRIQVRFFAGYGLDEFSSYDEMVSTGYQRGVHMGQNLRSEKDSPVFYLWAAKDPEGARLDRIQIIKGWSESGETHEKIYNVFASDGRIADADGRVAKLNSQLDLKTGEWDTSVGASELSGVWEDPDYVEDQESFYYMRVLEVETPRWTLYDEIQEGIPYPDDTKRTIQERAWSSPIWLGKL